MTSGKKAKALRRQALSAWKNLEQLEVTPKQLLSLPSVAAHAKKKGYVPNFDEAWHNNIYIVFLHYMDTPVGRIIHLAIARKDTEPSRSWRDFMRIKNQLAGEWSEAIEIYPAEARVNDKGNFYQLWCFPPEYEMPFGIPDGWTAHANERLVGLLRRREMPLPTPK